MQSRILPTSSVQVRLLVSTLKNYILILNRQHIAAYLHITKNEI